MATKRKTTKKPTKAKPAAESPELSLLAAGLCRIKAFKKLDRASIPARRVPGPVTEEELRLLELEENQQREPLTTWEQARDMVKETCSETGESEQVSRGKRGPARKRGSVRDMAKKLGAQRYGAEKDAAHAAAQSEATP